MTLLTLQQAVCNHCGARETVEKAGEASVILPAGWATLQVRVDVPAGEGTGAAQTFGAMQHLCPRCVPTLTPPEGPIE